MFRVMPTEPTNDPDPQPPATLNWSLAVSTSGKLTFTLSLETGCMSGWSCSASKCPMPMSIRSVRISSARLYNSPGKT
ncbi:MAG: hypothetical protein L6V80_02055 [Bacteroidales bacterium]|nr:MAG: hypothetical protein L6V80_02055 [Bacteroidales bacterium]